VGGGDAATIAPVVAARAAVLCRNRSFAGDATPAGEDDADATCPPAGEDEDEDEDENEDIAAAAAAAAAAVAAAGEDAEDGGEPRSGDVTGVRSSF